MSISSEITRLSGNVSDALTAIAAKGVTVPSGSNSDDLATLIGQIQAGGGGGLEYETGSYTPTSDINRPTISFTNSHTGRPFSVVLWDTTGTAPASNSSQAWSISSWYDISGDTITGTSTGVVYYARVQFLYWSTSTGSNGANISALTGGSNNCFDYYISSSWFQPYGGSTSRYWRAGRTYKWIAIWAPST